MPPHPIAGAHIVFHRFLKVTPKRTVQAVLLCKRTHDAPIHPGHWAVFGGARKDRERPEETARREVKEELGIDLAPQALKRLCDVTVKRMDRTVLVRYFSSSLNVDMHKLTLQWNAEHKKVEGEALGWFDEEEIHHLTVSPDDRKAIIAFFDGNATMPA
jgi:8-oxo-dGTP pyrophosphatase MutT (NUDIX family)